MKQKQLYTFFVCNETNARIGWRKTAKKSSQFAALLLERFNHNVVIIRKEKRKPEDFPKKVNI